MKIIDGKKIAAGILAELKKEIKDKKINPGLGIVLVGEKPSSILYIKAKETAAQGIGVGVKKQVLSGQAAESEVLAAVEAFNQDAQIDGILVQLPLPKSISADKIIQAIRPEKDADGFLPESRFDSPFISAIWRAIEATGENLKGKKALALVKSNLFGQALAEFLDKKGLSCDYAVCGEKWDCPAKAKSADIVITALGQPNFIQAAMIKKGAILIDGGISQKDGRTIGDIDAESVKQKAGWLAPVPGGVGPLTVAFLLKNVVLASQVR